MERKRERKRDANAISYLRKREKRDGEKERE